MMWLYFIVRDVALIAAAVCLVLHDRPWWAVFCLGFFAVNAIVGFKVKGDV